MYVLKKNHAGIILKMLKLVVVLKFFALLKYKLMLLHLRNIISVSRDLFEAVFL